MANYKKSASSTKILTFVLTVVFGLLAAVVAFATFRNGSFELRTKAAAEEVVLKQWLFEKDTEGWNAQDVGKSTVRGGNYSLEIGKKSELVRPQEVCTGKEKNKCRIRNVVTPLSPRVEHAAVETVLKYVQHKLRIRMALVFPQSTRPPGCQPPPTCAYLREPCKYERPGVTFCHKDTIQKVQENVGTGREQRLTNIPMSVSYRLQGKQVFETALGFVGIIDGTVREYSLDLPKEVSLKRIDELRVSFGDLRKEAGARVDIADISIIGLKEVSKPPQGQIYQGLVIKNAASEASMPYVLTVGNPSVEGRNMMYRLAQENTIQGCPVGILCKLRSRPIEIDFGQYVGKYVEVMGTQGKSREWTDTEKNPASQPIIYVTSIKLAGDTKPCQPIPAGCMDANANIRCKIALMDGYQWCNLQAETQPPKGCYTQKVQCVKAPCEDVVICPATQSTYTCPETEFIDCMPGPVEAKKNIRCATDYLTWAKASCPNFKGAAY